MQHIKGTNMTIKKITCPTDKLYNECVEKLTYWRYLIASKSQQSSSKIQELTIAYCFTCATSALMDSIKFLMWYKGYQNQEITFDAFDALNYTDYKNVYTDYSISYNGLTDEERKFIQPKVEEIMDLCKRVERLSYACK